MTSGSVGRSKSRDTLLPFEPIGPHMVVTSSTCPSGWFFLGLLSLRCQYPGLPGFLSGFSGITQFPIEAMLLFGNLEILLCWDTGGCCRPDLGYFEEPILKPCPLPARPRGLEDTSALSQALPTLKGRYCGDFSLSFSNGVTVKCWWPDKVAKLVQSNAVI